MKKIVLTIVLILSVIQSYGQVLKVSGRVADSEGGPLEGVTVYVKGDKTSYTVTASD